MYFLQRFVFSIRKKRWLLNVEQKKCYGIHSKKKTSSITARIPSMKCRTFSIPNVIFPFQRAFFPCTQTFSIKKNKYLTNQTHMLIEVHCAIVNSMSQYSTTSKWKHCYLQMCFLFCFGFLLAFFVLQLCNENSSNGSLAKKLQNIAISKTTFLRQFILFELVFLSQIVYLFFLL